MTQKIYSVPSYWKDFLKEEFRTCSEYLQWLRCIQDRKECNRFTKKRRDLSTQPTNWDLNFDRRFFRKTRRQARYFLLFSFRRQKFSSTHCKEKYKEFLGCEKIRIFWPKSNTLPHCLLAHNFNLKLLPFILDAS